MLAAELDETRGLLATEVTIRAEMERQVGAPPPPPFPVLTGQVSSLPSY